MANQLLDTDETRKSKLTGCCAVPKSISSQFLDPELSDVCFLVGDEREKIYAHRFLLAVESEVFKSMFYGELKETKCEIEIPDLSPVGFKNLLKYFYTKKVEEIDLSEIYPTYMAANKYLASGLIEDFNDKCLNASNVCVIYDQLLKLNIDDSLTGEVKRRIAAEFSAACASDSFKQIDQDTLISILSFNWLDIIEFDLLKACMRWADSEVVRQGLAPDQANKRAVFESIKHLIRFGDLSLSDFASIPEIKNYLTMEQIASVFLHPSHPNEPIQIDYASPRRPGPKAGVARRIKPENIFGAHFKAPSNFKQKFSVRVNKRVRICSIKTLNIFSCTGIKVKIYKNNEWIKLDCKIVAKGAGDYKTFTIDFSQIFEPNLDYELRFTFSPENTSELYILGSKETSLRSDDTVFEIKYVGLKSHCFDSIEFHGPLD